MIGTTLGNYQIQALLGTGGMASVYQALDLRLGRLVALKVLSAATAAQPDVVARFQQEARLIANLRHPNIVQIYDLGEQDGHWYMVQELLPGPTLAAQLRTVAAQHATPPREQVLDIARQLATALDVAHAAGVIHRDVKPGNAIWNGAKLVLTDFGIAKNTQLPTEHTQTGMVIGTPSYLSPEQAQGQPPTASSDIYSLGVVLYQLIAGKLPFNDASPLGAVYGHLQEAPPPLRPLRPDLPFAAERVVLQALAKDPTARFRSAGALAKALEQAWPSGAQPLAGASTTMHERPTQLWSQPIRPAAPQSPATSQAIEASAAIPAAAPRRRDKPGLVIGGFVAALALIGIMISRNGVGPTVPNAPAIPGSSAPAPAVEALTPTAVPEPSATIEPTTPPEPSATIEPTTPPEPTAAPEPTEVPAELDRSVGLLRELLLAGQADGRAGKHADAFIDELDQASRALIDGNARRATDRLRDLQKQLSEQARAEQIDATFADQALDGVAAIASHYDLKLPAVKRPKKD